MPLVGNFPFCLPCLRTQTLSIKLKLIASRTQERQADSDRQFHVPVIQKARSETHTIHTPAFGAASPERKKAGALPAKAINSRRVITHNSMAKAGRREPISPHPGHSFCGRLLQKHPNLHWR